MTTAAQSSVSANADADVSGCGPEGLLARYHRATAALEPPFAVVDLDAFWANAADLVRRACGKPIRLATKSVRCRELQTRVLAGPGFRGSLCFTLPEALWLAELGFDDLVVAYPTTNVGAVVRLRRLLAERPGLRLSLMVDSQEHLDLLAPGPEGGPPVDVCIDIDAGWSALGGRVRLGAKRSPVRTAAAAAALAQTIARRPYLRLVGLMAYEAQIAGMGDAPPGKPITALAVRAFQSGSRRELARRRGEVVAAVQQVASITFVNGGGTGSIDSTARESAITELAAGSGLFGPALFSSYRAFEPAPAAFFVLPVVRKPSTRTVTVLGGGYVASGRADETRLPRPYLPTGLRLDRWEGAGEVQTPLAGRAASHLRLGDRVFFRHAKAGELCERFDRLYLIEGDTVTDEVPTYRGEGMTML